SARSARQTSLAPMRQGTLFAVAAGALALATCAAPPAEAAGLSAPRLITARGGPVAHPRAAIGPRGRTALLWQRFRFRKRVTAIDWIGVLGDSPDTLGKP